MTVSTKINERCLKARFDSRDLRFVDVGLGLHTLTVFDIQIVKALAVHHRDTHLFRLRGVNQHFFHNNVQLAIQLGGAGIDLSPDLRSHL